MVDQYFKADGSPAFLCKLVDFGFSKSIKEGEKLQLSLGTPLYMAPEIVKQRPYDMSVDVWALGILCFALLTSTFPFDGATREAINAQISGQAQPDWS